MSGAERKEVIDMRRTEAVVLPISFEKTLNVLDVKNMHDFIPFIKDTQEYSDGGRILYRQTVVFEGNAFTYDVEELEKNVGKDLATGKYIVYINDKINLLVHLDFTLRKIDVNSTELEIDYEIEPVNNNFINRGIVSIIHSKLTKDYMPKIKDQLVQFANVL